MGSVATRFEGLPVRRLAVVRRLIFICFTRPSTLVNHVLNRFAGGLLWLTLLVGLSGPGLAQLITTVAGTDTLGLNGDEGAATEAGLSGPSGVAVDGAGNLFIADRSNGRIRRVAFSTGLITTVAGTDTCGFSGDGGAATEARLSSPVGVAVDGAGNLFIADSDNHRIRRVAQGPSPSRG